MTTHHTELSSAVLQRQKNNERTLLGMAVCGKEPQKGHIMEHISRDMFIDKTNLELFDVIADQYQKYGANRLNPDNLINDYQAKIYKNGVLEALLALDNEYITDANCDYYIKTIQESWLKRMVQNCKSLEELKELEKLKKQYELINKDSVCRINDLETINRLGDNYDLISKTKPIKTGYRAIDSIIGNFQGGDLFILAAATGMGKTCLMLNMALSMAKQGKKVLLFSLEMSNQQLLNRVISSETGINSNKYRNANFTEQEAERYFNYAYSDDFATLDIEICTEYNITTSRIRTVVLASKSDIVFIDYLGLISGGNKTNSYERVSEISRELKLLAMESKKPFIVLHQLNRANAERKDKRPLLSDLRDSGKIEQDADIIGFVFRPAYYTDTTTIQNQNEMQLIIAKNRHGQSGIVAKLNYNSDTQKVSDIKPKTSWAYGI